MVRLVLSPGGDGYANSLFILFRAGCVYFGVNQLTISALPFLTSHFRFLSVLALVAPFFLISLYSTPLALGGMVDSRKLYATFFSPRIKGFEGDKKAT
jgi:hypothetical protein